MAVHFEHGVVDRERKDVAAHRVVRSEQLRSIACRPPLLAEGTPPVRSPSGPRRAFCPLTRARARSTALAARGEGPSAICRLHNLAAETPVFPLNVREDGHISCCSIHRAKAKGDTP